MNNLQHLVSLLSKRGIEFTSEEDEFIDAIEQNLSDGEDAIRENRKIEKLECEIEHLQQENYSLEKENLEYENDGVLDFDTIKLSGGIIRADIDSLDYMTRESFKQWCMQHAITNSEPVFNL